MTDLKRSLRMFDGLAMVVGIVVGAGIFRTPGLVANQLGRPWLTFVAWVAGGALAFLGALIFAELATRFPRAGGKYVYAREAFGPRAAFVIGAVEGLALYPAAIARVNAGGTPGPAMAVVGAVAALLAATGTFGGLLSLAILLVLVIDGFTVAALFRLRARQPDAPFRVPFYPYVPALFIAVYAALLVGAALAQPRLALMAAAVLVGTWALSWTVKG